MSVETFESGMKPADDGLDDLQRLLRRVEAENPSIREGREDLRELHKILDELVAMRKQAGLSQTDVATKMGVKQPTVSQFETESSDPKVSTLQRYARAVGSQLSMSVGPVTTWTAGGSFPYSGRHVDFMVSSSGILALKPSYVVGKTLCSVAAAELSELPLLADFLRVANSNRADLALGA